jgi:hypothetical protein
MIQIILTRVVSAAKNDNYLFVVKGIISISSELLNSVVSTAIKFRLILFVTVEPPC